MAGLVYSLSSQALPSLVGHSTAAGPGTVRG